MPAVAAPIPQYEQQYQQTLYPQGYADANAGNYAPNVPNYQYGGYGPPAPPVPPVNRPAPPAPGRPAPPTPGRPAPPGGNTPWLNARNADGSPNTSWARWHYIHPEDGQDHTRYNNWLNKYAGKGATIAGLPTGVGTMSVGVGYPDHYHVGYDPYQRPIYQDRYGRHHYGHQTGYLAAAPPDSTPPGAPPGAAVAPIVVAPPAAAGSPVVVVQHPSGATTPWYGGVAAQLRLPHPAGAALISAIGAGIGAFAGLKFGHKLPARLHLDTVSATAAGAAVGAGVAGGVAAMLISKTAHAQHASTTGTPPPA